MPLSMRPVITCKKCDGLGTVPMPPELQQTLRQVVEGDGTTEAILRRDPDRLVITRAAINARLEDLLKEGMVTRAKGPGKFFIYTATAKGRSLTPTKRKQTSGSVTTRKR